MRRSLLRIARLYVLSFRCTGSFTWSNSALWICSTSSIDGSLTWSNLRKRHFHVLPDLTIQVRVGARMRWTVLALGVFLVMEQTPIFGLRVAEPDYLAWLRPLIASSKGSVSPFQCYYKTDSSADGIWDASNWGHFRPFLLRGDVVLVGTSADKER